MKAAAIFITILIFIFSFNQKEKLEGEYRFKFTDGVMLDMDIIKFKNKSYSIKTVGHKKRQGTIQYARNSVYLDENPETNIIISIRNEEIGKDTITFCVHDRKSKFMNYLDHCVGLGLLIKSK